MIRRQRSRDAWGGRPHVCRSPRRRTAAAHGGAAAHGASSSRRDRPRSSHLANLRDSTRVLPSSKGKHARRSSACPLEPCSWMRRQGRAYLNGIACREGSSGGCGSPFASLRVHTRTRSFTRRDRMRCFGLCCAWSLDSRVRARVPRRATRARATTHHRALRSDTCRSPSDG